METERSAREIQFHREYNDIAMKSKLYSRIHKPSRVTRLSYAVCSFPYCSFVSRTCLPITFTKDPFILQAPNGTRVSRPGDTFLSCRIRCQSSARSNPGSCFSILWVAGV